MIIRPNRTGLVLVVTSFSDKDRVERYKNITIIPPKKIKEIAKKSQVEFMMPDIIAA